MLHCWSSFLFASRVKAFVPQQCLLLRLFQEQTHCAVRHAHWRLLASEQVRRASAWAAREWWHIKRVKIQAQGDMTISRTFCFWAETGKQMKAHEMHFSDHHECPVNICFDVICFKLNYFLPLSLFDRTRNKDATTLRSLQSWDMSLVTGSLAIQSRILSSVRWLIVSLLNYKGEAGPSTLRVAVMLTETINMES